MIHDAAIVLCDLDGRTRKDAARLLQIPEGTVEFYGEGHGAGRGRSDGGGRPAVLLLKGVMKAILLKKLRLAVGAVTVLLALGTVGFGYPLSAGSRSPSCPCA